MSWLDDLSGYSNGISTLLFFPALFGMVVAPQVALVAGTLAAWRALRRRRVASRWRWLRSRPWLLGGLAALAVGLALGAFEAHAEHSVVEGIQRGMFEGFVAAVGFVVLGRAIGARPAPIPVESTAPMPLLTAPPDRLVADGDRARAEFLLREGYADGRLTLDDLDDRISAVHAARTVSELRAAVADIALPS